jgi:hypothetical protein
VGTAETGGSVLVLPVFPRPGPGRPFRLPRVPVAFGITCRSSPSLASAVDIEVLDKGAPELVQTVARSLRHGREPATFGLP